MRISVEQIAFDIDGVVADTMSLWLYLARTRFQFCDWRYEDITDYSLVKCFGVSKEELWPITELILDQPHILGLKPMPGAVEALTRFSRTAPLLLVTARPDCGPIETWFLQSFPDVDALSFSIVATGAASEKPRVLMEHGVRFFVEDRLDTCFALEERGITPIVYDQPWNRAPHPFVRVGGWEDIVTLLDGMDGD